MPRLSCGGCRYFVSAAEDLEREVAGLKILSSAFGSVRGETGLCQLLDLFCLPHHGCSDWRAAEVPGKNPNAAGLEGMGR